MNLPATVPGVGPSTGPHLALIPRALPLPVPARTGHPDPRLPPPLVIADAGHFVQERGDIIAAAAIDHFSGQGEHQ